MNLFLSDEYRKAVKLSLTAAILLLANLPSNPCSGQGVSAADRQKRRQAMATSDRLIVPGERIGPIRLGMGMDEVMATLGQPDWRTKLAPWEERAGIGPGWYFTDLNMAIFFSGGTAPEVRTVQTLVETYRTVKFGVITWADCKPVTTVFHSENGIQLGTSSFNVRRMFGSYSYKDDGISMNYQSLGISLLVTRDFRVWRISVDSPSSGE